MLSTKKTLLFFLCSAPLMGANIVFDLHGVLIAVRQSTYISMLPMSATAHYLTLDAPSFKGIKKDWFTFLTLLDDTPETTPAYDTSGLPVPKIMTDNLKGTVSCTTVCARAKELYDSKHSYFRSEAHRNFMYHLTCTIFTPELFMQGVSWFDEMIDLAIHYKQQGHRVYILSNLNDEHFAQLQTSYPHHIAFFDGYTVSGQVGLVKPDKALYHLFLATHKLNASETIFIDDQKINCDAAQECGITSILCPTRTSWYHLWHVAPDADQARRLIDLALNTRFKQLCEETAPR